VVELRISRSAWLEMTENNGATISHIKNLALLTM